MYTKLYKDVLKYRKTPLRDKLRALIIRLDALKSNLKKDFKGIQFLYFHYIYDDEIQNAEIIVEWIIKNFNVISYSEAIEKIKNNDINDNYVCFSSDDGILNNLVAARIFKKYGISCCFFINPATIENRNIEFQEKICVERLGIPVTNFLTWDHIHSLLEQGHEIGNHSYDHKIQASLSREEFLEDLKLSTEILEQKIGKIKHYAFPRGHFKYFKKEYLEEVYNFGYESCATAIRGSHVNQKSKSQINYMAIRRDVIVFYEPLLFVKYFMSKSQKSASYNNTFWIK